MNQIFEDDEPIEPDPKLNKMTIKVYRCTQCGYESKQNTNHSGDTWSWEHVNCCPNCPPFKKYPEFGGRTVWIFVKEA
jgi:hypothetical protein